jgi:hypothetical protein
MGGKNKAQRLRLQALPISALGSGLFVATFKGRVPNSTRAGPWDACFNRSDLYLNKLKHNRSLKVAVQGLVLWPTLYIHLNKLAFPPQAEWSKIKHYLLYFRNIKTLIETLLNFSFQTFSLR